MKKIDELVEYLLDYCEIEYKENYSYKFDEAPSFIADLVPYNAFSRRFLNKERLIVQDWPIDPNLAYKEASEHIKLCLLQNKTKRRELIKAFYEEWS